MQARRVIRVDEEVYARVLDVRHRLERVTGSVVTMGRTVAFLVALRHLGDLTIDELLQDEVDGMP